MLALRVWYFAWGVLCCCPLLRTQQLLLAVVVVEVVVVVACLWPLRCLQLQRACCVAL